jgi:hypothetical protein
MDEARSSQQQASSQNRVLDALTNLKHTGRIEGFHVRGLVWYSFPLS